MYEVKGIVMRIVRQCGSETERAIGNGEQRILLPRLKRRRNGCGGIQIIF
jgi:hypothetical protein